ncbi:hypothetical protein HGA88_04010 [Candidatus Roizmanbacteria bacterium]|nr:hypothetical protein [Candidatus Roizmanbacteria bacterium]
MTKNALHVVGKTLKRMGLFEEFNGIVAPPVTPLFKIDHERANSVRICDMGLHKRTEVTNNLADNMIFPLKQYSRNWIPSKNFFAQE